MLELPLSGDQRQELREFFASKAPTKQNDQVAVLAVKLKDQLKKNNLSGDEIHSAFKIVGLPTPKNLMAVFGNMKINGIANVSNGSLSVTSLTDDYVSFRMVAAKPAKK